jgi:RNA polymerase sigma factor (sigma-70 family)
VVEQMAVFVQPAPLAKGPADVCARTWGWTGVDERDEGFTRFFREEFTHVLRTVVLILRDRARAEEVTQDAFAELYSRWAKISRYERPDAWVRRVAIRMAVRLAKRDRTRAILEQDTGPASSTGRRDLDVLEAVRSLPGKQRAAVVLFYFEDRPVAEVGHILGCSEATAKVHLFRARRRLSEVLRMEVADVP